MPKFVKLVLANFFSTNCKYLLIEKRLLAGYIRVHWMQSSLLGCLGR